MKGKYSILIVDDNKENIKLLSEVLSKEGYKIRIALNGIRALESVSTEPPDLILMDIQMPNMDGYQTTLKIKENEKYESIPVIFVSSISESFNIIKAFKVGASDYISKPLRMEEVLARVNTHLLLRHKTEELEKTLHELEDTQIQLIQTEKLASLGQFTAGISHELNNPMNFVSNGANILTRDFENLFMVLEAYENKHDVSKIEKLKKNIRYKSLKEDIPMLLSAINEGAMRSGSIMKGLRSFAKIDQSEPQMSDIHGSLNMMLSLPKDRTVDIDIIKFFDPEIKQILCYPNELTLAFLNIINNALEAMVAEGTLTVRTESKDNHITISFKDSGKGIPTSIQGKIFDPFFTSKEVGEGPGLGLSMVHGIIEKHKGTIDVMSEEGKGSEFVITLPNISQ